MFIVCDPFLNLQNIKILTILSMPLGPREVRTASPTAKINEID